MKNTNVCAIIVTYNRKNLLLRTIRSIENQTYKVDAIYIVDNNSSDDTPFMLKEKGYIDDLPPLNLTNSWQTEKTILREGQYLMTYVYIRLERNVGGAGGFFEGLKLSYERGYNWFWLMDDDGYPSEDSLEMLLKYKSKADFVNPVVLDIEDRFSLAFRLFYRRKKKYIYSLDDVKKYNINGLLYDVASPFNGTLISKRLVDIIGYPKRELFIWGDEVEYLERSRKFGFVVVTVINSYHYHPKVMHDYRLFLGNKVLIPKNLLKRYCFYRNRAYIFFRYDIIFFFKYILFYFIYFLLKFNIKDLLFFLEAILDGIFQIWGKEKKFLI